MLLTDNIRSIDLLPILGYFSQTNYSDTYLYTNIENDRERICRVRLSNPHAKAWMSGQSVVDGDLVFMPKGRFRILIKLAILLPESAADIVLAFQLRETTLADESSALKKAQEHRRKALALQSGGRLSIPEENPSIHVSRNHWLGYSKKHDVLVIAQDRRLMGIQGKNGNVLWDLPLINGRDYMWPCIILEDVVMTQPLWYCYSKTFDLLTGKSVKTIESSTGKSRKKWQIRKTYGCNYAIGSPNLIMFRSGTGSYFDLNSDSGTSSFSGFRSGCNSSLIPAGGLITAPKFTKGCGCAYPMLTAASFVPMAWRYVDTRYRGKSYR